MEEQLRTKWCFSLHQEYGAERAALIDPEKATVDFMRGAPAFGSDTGKKTQIFWSRFLLRMIVLPRQARDKHRENTQQRDAFGSDTVSFQVVDGKGNAVSMVNSVYLGFGSGLVAEGCGFALQVTD